MFIHPDLVHLLQNYRQITVLTGAGISKESGIPTFREAQTGLWEKYQPTELATPQAFMRSPKLVWEWYQWRRSLVHQAAPNPGHLSLVEMETKTPSFHLITQNVDGLHQRAGTVNLIELHGNIMRTKCFEQNHPADKWLVEAEIPPRCPICGSRLRPDVVWFGEGIPSQALNQAINAATQADIFFSIGTSAVVEPAASLPLIAHQAGAVLVEINPDLTPITEFADFTITGPAGEILPELIKQSWPA